MPRVPSVSRVSSSPLSPPRVQSPGPSGLEAIGQGLQQVGAAVDQARQSAENVAAARAVADLQQTTTAEFYDADRGFLKKRGEEAFKAEEPAFKAFDQRVQQLQQGLTPRARGILESNAGAMRGSLQREAENHIGRQREVVQQETAQGVMASGLRLIAAGKWADPSALEQQVGLLESSAAGLALTPEGKAAKVAEVREKAYLIAVEQHLAAGDYAGARFLLTSQSKDLAFHKPALEKRIAAVEQGQLVERAARGMIAQARDPESGWVDTTAVVQALDKAGASKEVRETAMKYVRQADDAKKRAGEDRYNALISRFEQVGSLNDPQVRQIRAWMLDPKNGAAELWTKFERAERAERRAARTASREDRGLQAQLNAEAFTGFLAMPPEDQLALARDNPGAQLAAIEGEFPDADRTTKNKIIASLNSVQKRAKDGLLVEDGAFSKTVDANVAVIKDKKQREKVKGEIISWRMAHLVKSKGVEPTREEFLKEFGGRLLSGDYGFFGKDTFAYELTPEERTNLRVHPPEEQLAPINRSQGSPAPAAAPSTSSGLTDEELRSDLIRNGIANPTTDDIAQYRASLEN